MTHAFTKGDPVVYIPGHAGSASHHDAETGQIVAIGPFDGYDAQYLVDFSDGSPNAKLTRGEHLIHAKQEVA